VTQDELRVRAWAEVRELLELQLAPLGRRAIAALDPRPGAHVLDIGCGGGETIVELLRYVAPRGSVTGIDISPSVLAYARRAVANEQGVRLVQADAQLFPFETASFDLAFSRFGVMFFSEPTTAFRNIRRSIKPGGKLAFVCWRSLEENALDSMPLRAVADHLPPQHEADQSAPGPFALANRPRIERILNEAGFVEITITPHDVQVGSGDLDAMLAVCSRVGALGKILRENPALRDAVLPALRSALAKHDGPDGVTLRAATWIVTALSPGRGAL
jgi:SAM-dependent methyltransferase